MATEKIFWRWRPSACCICVIPTDAEMKKAYGGIVINAFGQVFLREPTGHLEGVSWTFPKGKQLEPPITTEPTL